MNRVARIAGVLVVAVLTAQGCLYGGKKRGTGTNIGPGWGSGDELPPPGQPPFREQPTAAGAP